MTTFRGFQRFNTRRDGGIQLIHDCVMCGQILLDNRDRVVLDPPTRERGVTPELRYYLEWAGGEEFRLTVGLLDGRSVHAELIDMGGRVLASGEAVATGSAAIGGRGPAGGPPGFGGDAAPRGATRTLTLAPRNLPPGVYTLALSGFGNGTPVSIRLPRGAIHPGGANP